SFSLFSPHHATTTPYTLSLHDALPISSHPPHMKTIMEHCGHPKVGLTWNSNTTDLHNGSVADSFKLLWPWIRSCHINELHKDSTDRKSTRLNSSHQIISYAVFCLKKKQ